MDNKNFRELQKLIADAYKGTAQLMTTAVQQNANSNGNAVSKEVIDNTQGDMGYLRANA